MKPHALCVLLFAAALTGPAFVQASSLEAGTWSVRFDLGVSLPKSPSLSLLDGPVTGGDTMELEAGIMFAGALGYRLTPWLILEGEVGVTFNEVESVGNWSYPDSFFSQLSLMANLVIEPPQGPLVPFAGIGAGGVLSSLTFGSYYYDSYYYNESDGYGTDFVPAIQAFAGLRYQFTPRTSLGVTYRLLATDRQKWDVDWWNGADFKVGVDSVVIHSISLVFSASF